MKTMDKSIKLPDRWKDWEITKSIGSGSYGDVYEAVYRGANPSVTTRKAAVKVIRIPSGSAEAAALAHEMPDIEDRIQYCQNIVDGLLSEIRTMEALRDNGHVVALQDYYVDYNEALPEWTIYIRMELLTPLSDYLETHTPDEKLVLRLGTQMCSALEECGEKGILHRDIKPENIMVTEDGTFKLGDFGLARQLDLTTASLSLKGTFTYMAPEVYHGEKYDVKADQYSLGIVLYRLLNRNRDPFVDPAVDMVYYKDREEALRRRMSGEQLPPPAEASEQLAAVIGKACAFSPDDRYDSISDLKHDLLVCAGEGTKTGAAKKGRKPLLIGIAAAILLVVIGVFASGILTKNPATLSGNSTEEKSGECGENVRWEVTEDGVLTISGQGMMDNYEILDQPPYHFAEIATNITELHVKEGVTGIGDYAFYMICLMQSMQLPESLEYIGDYAFIESWSLQRFDVGKNVTHIGQGILSNSDFLTSITVDADNPVYDSRDDCNAIIHTATDTLIAGCNNTIIPDGVKAIAPEVFCGLDELKEMHIPDSVESIGDGAFEYSGLLRFDMGKNVTDIGQEIFANCYSLESITVDADNPVYDSRDDCNAIIHTATDTLIAGCNGTIIPDGVKEIGPEALSDFNEIKEMRIPDSVKSIDDNAFGNSGLTRFDVGKNVTDIGKGILLGCDNLEIITVDADNPVYDSRNDCNAIIHTDTNTLIAGCINTIIPDGVKAIGPEAFLAYNYLKQIYVPDSVEYIDDLAFVAAGKDFVIYGSAGSAAEKYAAYRGCQFREQ